MATPIRPIPILTGDDALRFIQSADDAERNPKRIDFSKQREKCRKIIEKARSKGFFK